MDDAEFWIALLLIGLATLCFWDWQSETSISHYFYRSEAWLAPAGYAGHYGVCEAGGCN